MGRYITVTVLLVACVSDSSSPIDGGSDATMDVSVDVATDATVDVFEAGPACNLSKPFGAPVAITELNTTKDDAVARLTHDELTVYFVRASPGSYDTADIFTATRQAKGQPFGSATPLALNDNTRGDFEPSPSDDLTLFFSSDRVGTLGAGDLFVATRSDVLHPFGGVTSVQGNINTTANEGYVYALPNSLTLYFRSGVNGTDDLFRATRPNTSATTFTTDPPSAFQSVNTATNEEAPVVSLDERTLYFASNRTDGGAKGGLDIWMATRPDTTSSFGNLTNVAELDTTADELPSWISDDGCRLYMSRITGAGDFDLYIATKPN